MIRNGNNTVTLTDSEFDTLLSRISLIRRLGAGTLSWNSPTEISESQIAPIPLRSLQHLGYCLMGGSRKAEYRNYSFRLTCGQRPFTCFVAVKSAPTLLGGEVADFLIVKDYRSHFAMVKYQDVPGLREHILNAAA